MELSNKLDLFISALLSLIFSIFIVAKVFDKEIIKNKFNGSGYKIGVSSRGVGSVEEKFGQYIVGDDFDLICWDIVSDPSTPGAYIGNKENLQQYVESKEIKKSPIIEKVNKIQDLLNS